MSKATDHVERITVNFTVEIPATLLKDESGTSAFGEIDLEADVALVQTWEGDLRVPGGINNVEYLDIVDIRYAGNGKHFPLEFLTRSEYERIFRSLSNEVEYR